MKMKFTKKLPSVFLSAAVFAGCLSGCGSAVSGQTTPSAASAASQKSEHPLRIVTTIFPEYDWARQILGSDPAGAELILLLDDGVDLHSYQPTAADVALISDCDVFVYVGGESDGWVDDALAEAANPEMQVLDLLDILGDSVREEELVEGMEAEEEHEDGGEEEEGPEYDEHVWLSLKNADVLCGAIADAIAAADPENAGTYQANCTAYQAQLRTLDEAYRAAVDAAPQKTLLFGDRFPFRYLVEDYGLTYYAAFVGCSADTEASFETVAFLANKMDEAALPAILTIESSDGKLARAILDASADNTRPVLVMDSMQSTTAADTADGASYLSIMEANLAVLKAALQ